MAAARVLLLVDSRVIGYQKIVEAVQENVTPVVFDGLVDSYAVILEKVAAAAPAGITYTTAGLVQHGSVYAPDYSVTRAESPAILGDLTSWQGVAGFFTALKTSYSVNIIDLISCLIYSNPQWVAAINNLETVTGINFRASSDKTGNLVTY